MTEYRDNTLLRGLLLEAAAEDLDALLAETGEVDTTPRFRKSMAALVADPKGWAKRRQRPVWRRAARMAAAILLACVLTLGILMLVSPKVYAAISQWFVYRYDTHILYHFSSDHDDVILMDYQPTYIPAGYSTDREYTCRPDEFTNTTEKTLFGVICAATVSDANGKILDMMMQSPYDTDDLGIAQGSSIVWRKRLEDAATLKIGTDAVCKAWAYRMEDL